MAVMGVQALRQMQHTAILFVCLGNICRSPTAEGVFRRLAAAATPPLDVEIDSAGTGAYHVGCPPDPRSLRAAQRRGIDLSALRARQVGRHDFEHFDLILAMDRSNLAALESQRPAFSHARLGLFLSYAEGLIDHDVPDPYFGADDGFDRVLDLVTLAAHGLVAALRQPA